MTEGRPVRSGCPAGDVSSPGVSRRGFLKAGAAGGAALLGAPALLAACAEAEEDGRGSGSAVAEPRFVEFYGEHQAGIAPAYIPPLGLMAAFKVLSPDRAALRETFRELTDEIQGLMSGRPPAVRGEAFPPTDSGILGAAPGPDNLSVVVSVGASLFDDRYGLADKLQAS